jgi:hypothetical protein
MGALDRTFSSALDLKQKKLESYLHHHHHHHHHHHQ